MVDPKNAIDYVYAVMTNSIALTLFGKLKSAIDQQKALTKLEIDQQTKYYDVTPHLRNVISK